MYNITEFDEQATTKHQALVNLTNKYREYLRSEESMGVLDGYWLAALEGGWTVTELDNLYRNLKHEMQCPECGRPSPTGETYATMCTACAERG